MAFDGVAALLVQPFSEFAFMRRALVAVVALALGAAPLVATVRKASYLGGLVEYTLDTPIGALFAISTAVAAPLPAGARVGVVLADHGVVAIPPG